MRVTVISCVFPPEPVVSSLTSAHVAQELAQRGHEVTVITAFPSRPAGRPYPSHKRRLFRIEQQEAGYRIVRCLATTSRRSTMASRFFENLSFGVTSACAALFSGRPDVIYANSWPIFAQALVSIVAFLLRSRLVLSVQDVYPESLSSQRRICETGFVAWALRWLDKTIAGRADALVVISGHFAQIYKDRGVDPRRVHVIPNWTEERHIRASCDPAAFRAEKGIPEDAFLVVYGGNVGVASGVDTLVEAWRHLAGQKAAWLLIAGDGGLLSACRGMAADAGLQRIVFHSPYPLEDNPRVLASADLLVLPTLGQQSLCSLPSKLVCYMLAGKPILCQALVQSDLAKTVEGAACGLVVAPGRPELLAAAIEQMRTSAVAERKQRGRAGEEFALQNFSKSALLPRLVNIIESSAPNHRGDRGSVPYQRSRTGTNAMARIRDLLIVSALLLALSPVLLLCALAVRRSSPGPILYRQRRLGLHARPFILLKFRTMIHHAPEFWNRDGSAYTGADDPRVTPVGRILRKTSLDELPQLFNVLRGEMSLVGPRPDQAEQIRFYTETEKRKLEVKPGITGLAQISGRNNISWERRKAMDVEYVDRQSFWFDLSLFARTIPYVLLRKDIHTDGHGPNPRATASH